MKTKRNDPCPCGSGKKYKACCLDRERAAEEMFDLIGLEEPLLEQAREVAFWEAGVFPLEVQVVDDPSLDPAMVLVTAGAIVLHGGALGHVPPGPAATAAEIAAAVRGVARRLGAYPARLRVRGAELAARVEERLGGTGVEVGGVDALPDLDAAAAEAFGFMERGGENPFPIAVPETWRATGVPPAEVAELFRAAARFYRAVPWATLDDVEALRAELPDGWAWIVSLMGSGGMETGLVMFAREEDYRALLGIQHPAEAFGPEGGESLSLTFGPRSELPAEMQREIAAAGWEVARPKAYPAVMGVRLPGDRWTAEHVRQLAAVTAAVAALAESGEVLDVEDEEPWTDVATGVRLGAFSTPDPEGEEAFPWAPMEVAAPACAEGPAADPEAVLRAHAGGDPDRLVAQEHERVERFAVYLEDEQKLGETTVRNHVANVQVWTDYLAGNAGVPAEAATELDLRVFLYDFYPRKVSAPQAMLRALPVSLGKYFRFLAEREGIAYPWAEAVLADRAALEARMDSAPGPFFWDAGVGEWRAELYDDLDERVMLHDFELPGTRGWPGEMPWEIAQLENELQRRWLIWRDQEVRAGTTEPAALRRALVKRQRAWERAPHPGLGGKTPYDVVKAAEKQKRPKARR